MSHTTTPLEPRPIAGLAVAEPQPLTPRQVAGEPPVPSAKTEVEESKPKSGGPGLLALLLGFFIIHSVSSGQAQYATNLLSPTTNGGVAVPYTTTLLGNAGQTFLFTNWLWNLAALPLPGYSQTQLSTNGGAFYVNITNVTTGWFTNAPSGMTTNGIAVVYTNTVTGQIFTNATYPALVGTSAPLLWMTNGVFGANTWSNQPAAAPNLPWATYTIQRY